MFNINGYKEKINSFFEIISENKDIVDIKLSEDNWTLKEMIGHLIDSASNNHQRFIRLQIEEKLDFPIYYEEYWKNITKIKDFDFLDLINLWKGYNYYLLHIIKNIDESKLKNAWKVHGEEWTLEFTVYDYFEHMDWHIDLYKNRMEEIKLRK